MMYRLGEARYRPVNTMRGVVLRKSGMGPRVGDTRLHRGTPQQFNQNHRWENVEPSQQASPWAIQDDLTFDDLTFDDLPWANQGNQGNLGLDDLSPSAAVPTPIDHRSVDLNALDPDDQAYVDSFGDRAPALLDLMTELKADFDAGILDYDDEKWDAYPEDLFEPAAVLLRIA